MMSKIVYDVEGLELVLVDDTIVNFDSHIDRYVNEGKIKTVNAINKLNESKSNINEQVKKMVIYYSYGKSNEEILFTKDDNNIYTSDILSVNDIVNMYDTYYSVFVNVIGSKEVLVKVNDVISVSDELNHFLGDKLFNTATTTSCCIHEEFLDIYKIFKLGIDDKEIIVTLDFRK